MKALLILTLSAGGLLRGDDISAGRWVVLDRAELGFRYASVNTGAVNQAQHQELLLGGIKFDSEGRYTLKAGLGTGPIFAGDWNNTGAGPQSAQGRMYWRQLFLSAEPVHGVAFQYGGLGLEPFGTGLAGLSGAGFVTGQRVVIKRSDLRLDRVAFTYGYLGDFDRPDMPNRFRRLGRANYRDLILEKKAGRATISTQLTNFGGRKVVSAGGTYRAPAGVLGRLEYYHRSNFRTANGFHAGAEKNFRGKFKAGAGFVSVDRYFGPLNADAFFDGRRWYVSASAPLRAGFTVSSLFNKGSGNNYRPPVGNFVSVGINYDLLTLLR